MNGKRKGSAAERELAALLSPFGEAIRHDQRYTGGKGNPDIEFLHRGKRYHVECKRVERLNIYCAISQAERDAVEGFTPVVVHRRNRGQWYITMRLSDWLAEVEG